MHALAWDGEVRHHVVPAVTYMVSKECTDSGFVIEAGAGNFNRAAIVKGPGVRPGMDELKSAEWIQENWAADLVISGGVACNSKLRSEAAVLAARTGLVLAIPEPRLCTDNGAMIAAAGALLEPDAEPWIQNADADLKLGA